MTERIVIKNLATIPEGPVTVAGWVDKVRDQKKVQFVVLRDESGAAQLVHPRAEESDPIADVISGLATGSFIRVTGPSAVSLLILWLGHKLKMSDRCGNGNGETGAQSSEEDKVRHLPTDSSIQVV